MVFGKKIVHIGIIDKFIPNYIEFIKNNFDFNNHKFIILGSIDKYPIKSYKNIININNIFQFMKLFELIILLNKSNKIILHGLFSNLLNLILLFNFWVLKKCYWVIWGGDLYLYKSKNKYLINKFNEFIRKIIIKKLGNFITYIKGDYNLTKKWYGSIGNYKECFMYESNIYKQINIKVEDKRYLNILVGNSSDKSNNHIEIFDKLKINKNKNFKIITPLTYGNDSYRNKIIELGKKCFGSNFIALIKFMDKDIYLKMLSSIDIIIFNHNRQQAMGNTISLLGMGKKVYIRSDTVQWDFFKELGIKVFDTIELLNKKSIENLFKFGKNDSLNNIKIIKNYFSEEKLIEQWNKIFIN